MAKISFAGWKDPLRRPRYIVWTIAAVLVLAAVVVVALGATSSYWFCANGCHKVQDDTIIAYNHSTHSEISCMACHMPVKANPVTFLLHKAEALGELYLTATNQFELPLNGESELSIEMKSTQCTQCHGENREITPSEGIVIDHKIHEEKGVNCTVCHNRIAHREDFELTLTDPTTGEPNQKHIVGMTMTACFRCHEQESGGLAGGQCSLCHPKDFKLVPPSHEPTATWFPKGHAEAAKEVYSEVASATAEAEAAAAEGGEEESSHASEEGSESVVPEMTPYHQVNECLTCHKEQFCEDCHGMEMPHPAEFKEPKAPNDPAGHPAIAKQKPAKCVMCHQPVKTDFCNKCHHGEAIDFEYAEGKPWMRQHPDAVAKSGVKSCTEKCHTTKFCSDCHTKVKAVPTSHKQANWLRPKTPTMTVYGKTPAKPSAIHATDAAASPESCAVCHGEGGPNAKFCKSCHGYEMPHPADFKKFHSKTGSKNPKSCSRCHTWRELCSNCHHVGSSTTKPWLNVHGSSVAKNGTTTCFEKCHQQKFCVTCHQKSKVVPASHKGKRFVRDMSAAKAQHVQLYEKDGGQCTLCHTGTAAELPSSKFCSGCHKLPMPHPDNFGAKGKGNGGEHQKLFEEKKTTKAVCANCHLPAFCNSCHHEGSSAGTPWLKQHPSLVKKNGAQACFDCHEETFCSYCHVRLNK